MKVIADQEIRVATLSGACVLFQPNVAREVSEEIGLLALQQGARQVGEAKEPEPVSEPAPETEVAEVIEPQDDVLTGIEKLVEAANPEDFKADGTPKASAVNRVVGRNVSTEQREAAWEAFITS